MHPYPIMSVQHSTLKHLPGAFIPMPKLQRCFSGLLQPTTMARTALMLYTS